MIYCYEPIRNFYTKFFGLDFWFWNILFQRKSGIKLVKGTFKCYIIDVGFISCLTTIRLTYQGLIWVLFASDYRTLPLRERNRKTLFLWEIVKNATWIGRDRVELSCESPKVPFCTAIGALLFRMTHLYLHKNLFFKPRFLPNWVTNDILKRFRRLLL